MSACVAIETRIGVELAEFSRYLWQRRIVHRIFDTPDGRQVLVVAREQDVADVRAAFERWRAGELPVAESPSRRAWLQCAGAAVA
ncbi:MAG TPA: rhomboid protease N-terminal domain-containing protein, partial [Pseudomonadales bacterium]|nr:rhomboid protease N-terminal domain-containing protein [Pseudomonadales bacterium]